jgi:ATP-binding cassette, subfamily B, bacterial PglK
MIRTLWKHISKYRKKQFLLILIIMVLASIAEVVSIGLVVPLLSALSSPEQVYQYESVQPILQMAGITNSAQLIFFITIAFITVSILSGVIRLVLLYTMTKLSFLTGAELNNNIYQRTLYQEYSVHISRNSSEIINGLITKTSTVVNGIIFPILTIISSLIIFVGIMSILLFINFEVAIISFLVFGFLYSLVMLRTQQKLKKNGHRIAVSTNKMVKTLQEGFGGIRDILIGNNQQFYCQIYKDVDMEFRKASADNLFITGSPKYVMESMGMVLIAVLAYVMSQQDGGLTAIIPVLGALALGAQRLIPVMQQLYNAYGEIRGAEASFRDIIMLLEQPLPSHATKKLEKPINFDKCIDIKNLSFRYKENTHWVLNNINLKIKKGSCVGFVGQTGSGKSTLLDIIMGLLTPTDGCVLVDGNLVDHKNIRLWQDHIAHVPQDVYLSDNSIEENIAFGIPKSKINHSMVKLAAKQSRISELIEGWESGYQTQVGELGARISGGQKQRVGIARALYQQADILVFDEATSALDYKTETEVMKEIGILKEDLTILIVAHRVEALEGCDQVFKLLHGETKQLK